MNHIIHERPGVYSSYDASTIIRGGRAVRTIGVAAKSSAGTKGVPVTLTSYEAGLTAFGEDAAPGMGALLRLLFLNGAFYFQIPPLLLIACAALLYALSLLFQGALARGRVTARVAEVLLEAEGIQVRLRGYLDTANHLTDAFSGLPVVLCTAASLKPVIGEEGVRWVEERGFLASAQPERIAALRLRLIPFSGIGGNGVLPAFLPQGLWMVEKSGEKKAFQAAVAVAARPFRQGYDILLNPEVHFEEKTKGIY